MTRSLKYFLQWVTAVGLLTFLNHSGIAQEFNWAPDYPVGSNIPVLEAPDQNGDIQNLVSLTGEKGLVLVFNRSFDWCPYCKAQLVDLQKAVPDLENAGLKIVTITYDPVDTLKLVEEDFAISFPMLHDEQLKHVDAFNIRNTDYKPGDFAYGVPQPGIMLIDPDGVILAKFSEENFRIRPDFSDVIAAARGL